MTVIAGVLLDIQGTLLDESNRAITGASQTVAILKGAGIAVRYVTNIDSVCATTILGRLSAVGIPAALDEVFSPAAALGSFLTAQPSSRCELLLPPDIASDFSDHAVQEGEQADFVVVGDLKEGFTYRRLNDALRQLLGGARLVALNKGRHYPGPDGPLLDTGAFASALEYAAATEAYVIGKPSSELLRLAVEDMGVAPRDAVMVGDDATGDVGGGSAVGAATVLVRTGKYTPDALSRAPVAPDLIIDSIADLPGALDALAAARRSDDAQSGQ
jgi:HAD superfamily hydrolase (TIGR01458 family)